MSGPLEELSRYVASGFGDWRYASLFFSLLQQILEFVRRHATYDFVKLLCTKDQVKGQIEAYHSPIVVLVNAFHVCVFDDLILYAKA